MGVKTGSRAAQDRSQIEAETIDAGLGHEMAKAVDNQLAHHGMIAGNGVAATGIVDENGRIIFGKTVICGVVETAEAQDPAELIAFAGMVEDQVENDGNSGLMQRGNGLSEFFHATGADARFQCHEGDRIIPPGIGKIQRLKMALIHPCSDRHQLYGVSADLLQM